MTLVVDSSAVMAMLLDEPEASAVEFALDRSDELLMSAATLVELAIVAEHRLGPAGAVAVAGALRIAAIDIATVDEDLAIEAIDAWRRFGKGRHPASLNYGDCFTYALARSLNAPVLCVGDDFTRTDADVLPLT